MPFSSSPRSAWPMIGVDGEKFPGRWVGEEGYAPTVGKASLLMTSLTVEELGSESGNAAPLDPPVLDSH